ncbi:Putative TM nitroreductase [Anaerovirgula multivorans]|uniref:Putative TM nitroreductase n=1 Tax=Anaerovirgula multivorans TaxID=312168 RepID=A0A239IFR8_9FIRM|nr:nitroreductase family protein [Anaerovirgula multivorans]SNS91264.1 Putative TM nitroreductase [Anaerovirgula multivorans]
MDIFETMKERHSVRTYNSRKIEPDVAKELQTLIDQCNKDSGLHIQLCLDEPNAFDGFMARYGKFTNVKNYIALIGKKAKDLDEKIGYYGEKIVLKATELGLGSCWVAATYSKSKCGATIDKGEKLVCVISLGYFDKGGVPHKTKSIEELSQSNGNMPDWFRRGMEAAQLAPTAMNQQKFLFILEGDKVIAKAGRGFYTKLDLGIVKCHFELGAGTENFKWSK